MRSVLLALAAALAVGLCAPDVAHADIIFNEDFDGGDDDFTQSAVNASKFIIEDITTMGWLTGISSAADNAFFASGVYNTTGDGVGLVLTIPGSGAGSTAGYENLALMIALGAAGTFEGIKPAPHPAPDFIQIKVNGTEIFNQLGDTFLTGAGRLFGDPETFYDFMFDISAFDGSAITVEVILGNSSNFETLGVDTIKILGDLIGQPPNPNPPNPPNHNNNNNNNSHNSVPEPGGVTLLAAACAVIGLRRRRKG